MRKTIQYTVRTLAYSTGFIALVALPQLLTHALGAPVYI